MTDIDLAWAAGFIDGEGCFDFSLKGSKPSVYLSLRVSQKVREPLDRLASIFGCGKIFGPYSGNHLQYRLDGVIQVAAAVELLRPYLCGPKLAQADQAVARAHHALLDNGPVWGRKYNGRGAGNDD